MAKAKKAPKRKRKHGNYTPGNGGEEKYIVVRMDGRSETVVAGPTTRILAVRVRDVMKDTEKNAHFAMRSEY